MNKLKIFTIPDGDWEALYVNGELKQDGHKISINDISKYVPIDKIKTYYIQNFDSDMDWFPKTIAEFPDHWMFES